MQSSHTHEFSDEWTCDSSAHWHAATCSHSGEISGKAEHDFNADGVCVICGYTLPDSQVFYAVTFDANGGKFGEETCKIINFSKNSSLSDCPLPEREGYAFSGWSRYSTGENLFGDEKITGELTIYAVWKRKLCVTFSANGGSFDGGLQSLTVQALSGEIIDMPTPPEREGYEFTGWFTLPEGGEEFDFTLPVAGDQTLYAGWRAEIFTVTYDTGVESEQRLVKYHNTAQFFAPERAGFIFYGWFTDVGCATPYNFDLAVEGDLVLYAGWYEIATNGAYVVRDITSDCNSPESAVYRTLTADFTESYAFYTYFAAFSDGEYTVNFSTSGAEVSLTAFNCAKGEQSEQTNCPADGWHSFKLTLKAGEVVYIKAYNAAGNGSAYFKLYVTAPDAD
ncbi:MAG: InlB B-repeat-containing protein [Candidatus Coproplasma sp.]